ncbi:hypothetical protein [Flavobacterium sp. 25HG05S-40]|uniref:hypothetical protein n=1 Tax=Flavobacterium sp. 25HG05S-40 TaxID=3458682 RepID=UPI004043C9AD
MKFKPLFTIIILALIGFIVHKIISYCFIPNIFEETFIHSTPELYGYFAVFSLIIVLTLIKIKEINIDYVGYTFLILTCFKMIVAYALLHPILEVTLPKTPTEKINFFIIFIYFLTIETVVTIRILNNKQ